MELEWDVEKMRKFMQNFYVVTGVRSSVYDSNYHKMIAYPEENSGICQLMHENEKGSSECRKSNMRAFELCNRAENTIVYKCHVGLNEVITPLMDRGVIIGYVIFGQITTISDKEMLLKLIGDACKKYHMKEVDVEHVSETVHIKSTQEIFAITRILEACTYYIINKDMIRLSKANLISKMDRYIESHICEPITVSGLCREIGVSKTRLYGIVNETLKKSIARYIKEKRINKAKKMLVETNLTITEIAQKVGIDDYNYFCVAFKKETGITAKKYRDSNR